MIEHTYYQSGHWAYRCSLCGLHEVFGSLKEAFDTGRTHGRECGP